VIQGPHPSGDDVVKVLSFEVPKRPKLRYLDLAEPIPGQMRSLDSRLTRRQESVIFANQLKYAYLQTAAAFSVDQSVQSKLADLHHELMEIFATDNVDQSQEYRQIIEHFTVLGFAAGYGEMQGEIAIRGKTESHTAFALTLLIAESMKDNTSQLALMDFSLQSGYIVARMGPESVKKLVATARAGKGKLTFMQ
jgi:hypothetical protein